MKFKVFHIFLFIVMHQILCAQYKNYEFSRVITATDTGFNRVLLPDDVPAKCKADLGDIRIIGISSTNETVEAPYILRQLTEQKTITTIPFKAINTVKNRSNISITYKLEKQPQPVINAIELQISEQNFDCLVNVEGSNDNKNWSLITENYRILSFQSEAQFYRYTTINFPPSQFDYYRVSLNGCEVKQGITALINNVKIREGIFNKYEIEKLKEETYKDNKSSLINIDLKESVSISRVQFHVNSQADYYRKIQIKAVLDSFKTPKGVALYRYINIYSGYLNSTESTTLDLVNTLTPSIQIEIFNRDDTPLQIDSIEVFGNPYSLVFKPQSGFKYLLVYGNKDAEAPQFDISFFTDKVPYILPLAKLSEEIATKKNDEADNAPPSKWWLWVLMIFIAILLSTATIVMIKNHTKK